MMREGRVFIIKTNAVPPSLIDFAPAIMITKEELFSSPISQKPIASRLGSEESDHDDVFILLIYQ